METPVEKRPLDATAREPPRSTGMRERVSVWVERGDKSGGVTHASYSAAVEDTEAVLGRIG